MLSIKGTKIQSDPMLRSEYTNESAGFGLWISMNKKREALLQFNKLTSENNIIGFHFEPVNTGRKRTHINGHLVIRKLTG